MTQHILTLAYNNMLAWSQKTTSEEVYVISVNSKEQYVLAKKTNGVFLQTREDYEMGLNTGFWASPSGGCTISLSGDQALFYQALQQVAKASFLAQELPSYPYEVELSLESPQYPHPFDEYLSPNEKPISGQLQPHLAHITEWFVACGTFRLFFDLLLTTTSCKGAVGRDINPLVKQFNDCMIMLLRLCHNREEFTSLHTKNFQQLKKILQDKLNTDTSMPPAMKAYYQNNLD